MGRQGQRRRSRTVGVNLLPAADKVSCHSSTLKLCIQEGLCLCLVCIYRITLVLSVPHRAVFMQVQTSLFISVYIIY